MENMQLLDEILVGRTDPLIYAFSTNTIPNYLKVGDTYRALATRLKEWKKRFPDLQEEYHEKALINQELFFRDFSVHQYLEDELERARLRPEQIEEGTYYSKEFFKETSADDIRHAIQDIKTCYENGIDKYQYYSAETHLPETYTYAPSGTWEPRPNQQDAVEAFVRAVNAGRTNLLMYAVMRFGKSFTSMLCANEIEAKIVLVVSAKADVKEEWKKTIQSADNFNDKYVFVESEDLNRDDHAIENIRNNNKRAVVFLTLQDLQGDEIKDKHRELFSNQVDLLIIDETHYGARAEKYGQVLRAANYQRDAKDKHASEDFIEITDAEEQLKVLDAKIRLHLSGTPYRILMGSEFSEEDIIAFCQFTDIVKAQEEWDEEHSLSDDYEEWRNPYYGFPQMIRFAFYPSNSARQKLEELKKSGHTYAFSALLKPKSIKKDEDGKHKEFVYENEVSELFEAIDGTRDDENVFGFLNYDKIKEGNMCRHIVIVLPYCASCDALESLIINNQERFRNLNDYTIINISGVDSPQKYSKINDVKMAIKQCEEVNQKTITLTVNRMLTGSTVEEWDTMIYLKDTSSPQEYDQAVFRLQNQYVRSLRDDDGHEIKYNMKPQTLLVDFDPHRMFIMQERKALVYNVNTENNGNSRLKDRIEEELRISPIIILNQDRLEKVEPIDVLQAVSEYSSARGVMDETRDIPVDFALFDVYEIRRIIELQSEIGSNRGLETDAATGEGEGSDLDVPSEDDENNNHEHHRDLQEDDNDGTEDNEEQVAKKFENKFRTYYLRILFYAFLTTGVVSSLEEVIESIDGEENERIAKNLNIDKNVLQIMLDNMNGFVLSQLDYKIQNINHLANDDDIEPIQRALTAIKKFERLSSSEVTTPDIITDGMMSLLPNSFYNDVVNDSHKVLDVASKAGEFAIAFVRHCEERGINRADIKESFLSIPTSSVAYEFTRKIYEVLNLDTSCIAEQFTSYDLVDHNQNNTSDYSKIAGILSQNKEFDKVDLGDSPSGGDEVKFDAILGNPPYSVMDGGAQVSSSPIYQEFVAMAKQMDPEYITLVTPTRWFAGGKNLGAFRREMLEDKHVMILHDFLHPEDIFPNTNNRGGVCYFFWEKAGDNTEVLPLIVTHSENNTVITDRRPLNTRDLGIFVRDSRAISILDKVLCVQSVVLSSYVSAAKAFGLRTFFIKDERFRKNSEGMDDPVLCYGRADNIGYVERTNITSHQEWIDAWKVFVPESNNIGTELSDDNQNSFVGKPGTVCTETFLVVGADLNLTEQAANNLSEYLKTKFARFLHRQAKISQHGTAKTYQFVPVMDFTKAWTDQELYETFELSEEEISCIESSIKPME